MSTDDLCPDPDSTHQCDNCQKIWSGEQLKPIVDIAQRLTPGCPTPSGECPECYALAYPFGPKEEYLERQGLWCPFCKSLVPPTKDKLKPAKHGGYEIRQRCTRCKKEWIAEYKLNDFREVEADT